MPGSQGQRTTGHSLVQMTEIVLPEDSNSRGTIFGGRVLSLIDKCAGIAASRHARRQAVTASMDSVIFINQVRVGDILLLRGRLNAAFGSSMEIDVEVMSESPTTGERRLTTRALVTMVAVDDDGRPTSVPALEALDEDERRRAKQATDRRRARLEARRQLED